MGHQTAIDSLRKTAESLITSEGDLLSNPDEIQETVGEKNKSQLHSMICIPNGLNNLEVVLENFTYFQLPCEILIEHCVNVKKKAMIYQARLVSTYHKEFTITLLQQKNVISVIHGFWIICVHFPPVIGFLACT